MYNINKIGIILENVSGEILICNGDRGNDLTKYFLEQIHDNHIKKIFYFTAGEWEMAQGIKEIDFDMLENVLVRNKAHMYVLLGGEDHENHLTYRYPKNNFTIFRFPTYCLHEVHYQALVNYGENFKTIINYNYLFDLYNHVPHFHRCLLIDELCKNNLLGNGIYTWNKIDKNYSKYKFECWQEELKIIDKEFLNTPARNQYTNDLLLNQGIISIIPESTTEHMDYTEKTFRAIYFEKPFYIYGRIGQNKNIKKYGFEIFEELFEYETEDKGYLKRRCAGLINNLKKLKTKDILELYKTIEWKLKHNKKRYLEIIEQDDYLPKGLLNLFIEHKDEFINSPILPNYFIEVLNKNAKLYNKIFI
jgi:hypothetical protein